MAAAVERSTTAARKSDRMGVIAIVHDQATLDRIQGVIRELQLDDELSFEATLDAALRRLSEGASPRVLVIDLSESPAPISELSSARAVGGSDLKILALGTVNDVGLYRDMVAAGATD
jgi:pilus assembly protein CpaE